MPVQDLVVDLVVREHLRARGVTGGATQLHEVRLVNGARV
jgi:hypothetical protein